MIYYKDPIPYGHALCSYCQSEFDLSDAKPTFAELVKLGDPLVYILCKVCNQEFDSVDFKAKRHIENLCIRNFKLTGYMPNGCIPPWAITSVLTLELNGNDLVKAVENGHGLTEKEYLNMSTDLVGSWQICYASHSVDVAHAEKDGHE